MQLGMSLAVIFETASLAAAAKIKACHHPFQVATADITVQVYPAFQSMQAIVLLLKF